MKRYKNTFRSKLLDYINSLSGIIVLRKDIQQLNNPRQISRGLKALVDDGNLVKLGSGVYAKARQSKYISTPIIQSGFTDACIEVLDRFGVEWELGQAIQDYNSGRSQQVPARFEIKLNSRFRRKLAYGNQKLQIQGMTYAR